MIIPIAIFAVIALVVAALWAHKTRNDQNYQPLHKMRSKWRGLARRERLLWFGGIIATAVIFGSGGWAIAASTGTSSCTGTDIDPNTHHVTLDCYIGGLPTVTSTGTPNPTTSNPTTPNPTTPNPTTPAPTTPNPTTLPPTTTSAPPTTSPAPSPSPSTTPPSGTCPVAGKNVPGAADPWGGCWPGPGNTGVPSWVTLTPYTGSCTISVANTVIESKHVTCATLSIRAAGVILSDSWFDGTDIENGMRPTDNVPTTPHYQFTIHDSLVTNGARDQCACIGYHDFTAQHVEVRGGNRSMYCEERCTIQNSWLHGQQLQGSQHGSGLREEQYTSATHNALTCDYPIFNDATTLGCSAALTGYADFASIHNNAIGRNLFLYSPAASYCSYGGGSGPKPYSSDPQNATYQVFTENVYQRGASGVCAAYGPITDFITGRTGNQWSGNVWDNGGVVSPA